MTSIAAWSSRKSISASSPASSPSSRSWSPGQLNGRSTCCLSFTVALRFDAERTVEGLRLILWGAFKKIVIADRLAIYVNTVYNTPGHYSGLPLMIATIFFAFQIYGDFSAYTDIAVGDGENPRLRPDAQLPPALFRPLGARFLGALAHLALNLVSRLPVYPAGRQPRAFRALPAQPDDRLSGQRLVARRKLDVRHLGGAAWPLHRR